MRRASAVRGVDTALLLAPVLVIAALEAFGSRWVGQRILPFVALPGLAAWAIWLRRSTRPTRERWMVGVALCAAALLLGVSGVLAWRASAAGQDLPPAKVAAAYESYWRELELRAAGAARDLLAEPAAIADPARAFALLERGTRPARIEGLTLLLLAADGEVLSWSGRGLLREPATGDAIAAGRFAYQSHATATAWVVQTLRRPADAHEAAWVVAGESRPLSASPPLLAAPAEDRRRSWRFGDSSGFGETVIGGGDRPRLVLGPTAPADDESASGSRGLGGAAVVLGFGLLGLAALRGLALGVLSGTVLRGRADHGVVAILVCGATLGISLGFGSPLSIALGTSFTLSLALVSTRRLTAGVEATLAAGRSDGVTAAVRRLLPLLAGAAIVAMAWAAPASWPDLAESAAFAPAAAALRLGLAAFLFAALSALVPRHGATVERSGWPLGIAVVVLAAAGALHDRGAVALPLLAVGLLFAAAGLARPGRRQTALFAAMVLVAMLGSAVAWQWGARARLSNELADLLAPLAPPSEELLSATERRLERHFSVFDLEAVVVPGRQPELDPDDLAYTLWRESPLARLDAASALVVEPFDGPVSSFSFGFPLDDLRRPDRSPARWESVAPSAWRALERSGEGRIAGGGRELGRLRWFLVPQPGFGVRDAEIRDLPTTLLGAKRSAELAAARTLALPADSGVAVVLYGPEGEIELSPWSEGTPALALLRGASAGGEELVASPAGRARFTLREAPGATLALIAPRLTPGSASERIGTQLAGTLFVAALAAALAALLALPRATARDLAARTFRSYSKRLILVYSALLLVPLVLLYALLSESLGQRVLREQRLAAQAALTSAQRVLGEYVLSLEPGFGLDTALDDELLVWLSRVVGHEIHLYWNGLVYASSQPELFAAGFLPRRVPGEIWRGAAYGGERLMTRTTRAGEARYVELYAPLLVPGVDPRASRLLLSMPLLAQQEEALVETARIRRRTLLATLAAFLLLAAVGVRLARSFTRPILDLVAGTKRIAGGAPALGVTPRVDELSALAEAIDRMARRIAEGRDQLVREKLLVEGIVESVTSGVVGVDRSGRVLLANRVARHLLDVEPGESLLERLDLQPELAELRRFIARSAGEAAPVTARAVLSGRGGRDWSLVWVPLAEAGEAGGLLVVEDVSEVLRAQRLEAWAAMARLIAHEIKNPLTPIRLSTEHLRDVWQRDRAHFESVFDRCTANILIQVDELRDIASEFSIYSHIPRSERTAGDLVATLREVVAGYQAAPPRGVTVRFEPALETLPAKFDARLIGRAVRNLLENALRASSGGGEVRVELGAEEGAEPGFEHEPGTAPDAATAWIRVRDDGPGVPEEQLARIFEPYFSTHSGGTGLGLPIALRIAEEHGGTIRAMNRPSGGLEVTITIPRE